MQALRRVGPHPGEYALEEVPPPRIGPGEVLLEVRACGICGSDLESYQRHLPYWEKPPSIPGHEFCGVVVGKGPQVEQFQIGDRVACETAAIVCGRCPLCLQGEYNLCPHRKGFGFGVDGAFTEYVKAPPERLHRLPEKVPFSWGALTEPLCVAYNALINKSEIHPGDTVVVIGCGPVGFLSAQIALSVGAKVILSGTSHDQVRLQVARESGVTSAVTENLLGEAVTDLTQGRGADLVVDAVGGNSQTLLQALQIVRPGGQITKIGWFHSPFNFSLDLLVAKAIRLQGSFSHNWWVWESALRLMESGRLRLDPLITHLLPLSRWEEGFRLALERKAGKVILVPDRVFSSNGILP